MKYCLYDSIYNLSNIDGFDLMNVVTFFNWSLILSNYNDTNGEGLSIKAFWTVNIL